MSILEFYKNNQKQVYELRERFIKNNLYYIVISISIINYFN